MRSEDAVAEVRKGAGWLRLEALGLIRVSGPQRVKFLHNLLSNDISGLATGQSRLAALMNLKGHQVAWMRVMAESDALICELPVAVRDTVVETFIHYKVGAPVRFEKPEAVVFGLFGARAGETLISLGLTTLPGEADTFVTDSLALGRVRLSRGRDMPAGGFTLHVDHAAALAVEEKLRTVMRDPIAPEILDTLRIEEGIPWHGIDIQEENLLHETGQLSVYHSASKGCYLGQEVVARLEGRGGNVNKRFVGLKCAHPIAAGADIMADGKKVGSVTTAGVSPSFGNIAMGFIHRAHAEPGTAVSVGSLEAAVVALPFAS